MYVACGLLHNARVCCYGSILSEYFDVSSPEKLMIISTEAEKTLNQSKMTISPWKTELVINKTCLRNATKAKYMPPKLTH